MPVFLVVTGDISLITTIYIYTTYRQY